MPIFSAGSASVSIVPDFSGAQKAIGEFFARQSDIKVKVKPDLANGDMLRTEAELNALHGEAKVGVDHNFLTESISTALYEAFSRSGLDKLGSVLEGAIKPTVLTALGGALVELAAVASQAVGALALAPAVLAGIAAPAATVAIGIHGVAAAFKAIDTGDATKIADAMAKLAPAAQDLVTQVHALGPAWTALRLDVQQNLLNGVGSAITALAHVALPILRTGLVDIAQAMNSGLLATMTALQGQGANFTTLFGNIAAALRVSVAAAVPLVQAFGTLGAVGSQFLPQLAQGFVNVATAFNAWVQRVADSGQLVVIIQNAIDALREFGDLALRVGSIIGGIFTAALPYGHILLGLLIDLTSALSVFIHSADGQAALGSFFSGITVAMGTLLPALGVLAQVVVSSVLPAIGQFAALLAPIGATLLVQLASVLTQVAQILPPVVTVMAALVNAMAPLIPVIGTIITTLLPPLVKLFGDLAPIIGAAANVLGGALVSAAQAIAPILPPLAAAFVTIAQALGGALASAVSAIVPVLPVLADAFGHIVLALAPLVPPLIQIAQQLLPPLLSIVVALVPFVTSLVDALAPMLSIFLSLVNAVVLPLLVNLLNLMAAALSVISPILGPLVAVILAIVAAVKVWTIVMGILDLVLDANPIVLIIAAIGLLVVAIGEIVTHLQFFKDLWTTVWSAIKDFFVTIWTAVRDFFVNTWTAVTDWFTGVINSFVTTWQGIWTGIRDFFEAIWNAISSFVQTVFGAIRDFFVAIWTAVSNYLHTVWQENKDWITAVWTAIHDFAVTIFTAIKDFFVAIWTAISDFFHAIWTAISDFFHAIWDALSSWFTTALNALLALWQTIWTAISSFFSNIWNAISSFFHSIWDAIVSWFTTQLNNFVSLWQTIWNGISGFFSTIWQGIHDTAVSIWNAISGFFSSAFDAFKNAFVAVWNTISSAFTSIWQGMKDAVATIWEGIKAVFAAPINFVIRYILNDGLFKAWNWIVDHLALPGHGQSETGPNSGWKLHVDEIPGFSEGGFTGNMDRRAPAGIVHGGEYVFTADQTKAAGTGNLAAYAAALDGRSGGFYKGGLVPSRLAAVLPGYIGGGGVAPGATTWQQLWDIVHKHDSSAILTSGYRPGANDLHGAGDAIDVSYPGNPQSRLEPLAAWIVANYPGSSEIIHNPNASVKNGRQVPPSFWGAATWAAHQNHVHWGELPAALVTGGTAGGTGTANFTGFFGEVWNTITDILGDLNNSIVKPLASLYSQFGSTGVGGLVGGIPGGVIKMLWDGLSGEIGKYFSAITDPNSNTPTDAAGLQQQAYGTAQLMYGWGSPADRAAIDYIVGHESGWNPRAQNPVSTASGLWQQIDSTWNSNKPLDASGYGHMKDAPSGMQDKAGIKYVHDRYGTLPAAQSYWQAHHYYDGGGWLPPGATSVYNGTGGFEAVLNQAQQAAVVGAINGGSGPTEFTGNLYLDSGEFLGKVRGVATDVVNAHSAHDSRTIRSNL